MMMAVMEFLMMYVFICPMNINLAADGTLLQFVFDPDTSIGLYLLDDS